MAKPQTQVQDKETNKTEEIVKTEEIKVVVFDATAYIKEAGSKSAAIRKLVASGKTRGETAKLLGIRYQHVRNVLITPVKNPKTVTATA